MEHKFYRNKGQGFVGKNNKGKEYVLTYVSMDARIDDLWIYVRTYVMGFILICVCGLCGAVVSLSLSERKIVGSNPSMVAHTQCKSTRLAPRYLANARAIYPI